MQKVHSKICDPFNLYCIQQRPVLMKLHKDESPQKITGMLTNNWINMTQNEKQAYIEKAESLSYNNLKDDFYFKSEIRKELKRSDTGSSSPCEEETLASITENLKIPKITVIHRNNFGESISQTSKFSLIIFEKHT